MPYRPSSLPASSLLATDYADAAADRALASSARCSLDSLAGRPMPKLKPTAGSIREFTRRPTRMRELTAVA